jgi:hypothetical protein
MVHSKWLAAPAEAYCCAAIVGPGSASVFAARFYCHTKIHECEYLTNHWVAIECMTLHAAIILIVSNGSGVSEHPFDEMKALNAAVSHGLSLQKGQ